MTQPSDKNVTWLIQTDLLKGTLSEKLPDVIRDLGYTVKIHPGKIQDYMDLYDSFGQLDEGSGPIICHGSQKFIRTCMQMPYYPGYYPQNDEEIKKLRPQVFMPNFDNKDLLNSNYFFVPIKELIRNSHYYCNLLKTNWLFVKDCETFKRFSAKSLYNGNYNNEGELQCQLTLYKDANHIDDDSLVLVSSTVENIISEHRFFIVDKQVVSYSTYRFNNILDIRIDVPQKALEFAERLAKQWSPCACFTLDVAMINYNNTMKDDDIETAEPRLIELNSFSCSGFYACDLEKTVIAVSEKTIKDYNDNQLIYNY